MSRSIFGFKFLNSYLISVLIFISTSTVFAVQAVPAHVSANLNQLLPSSREAFIYDHYFEIKNETRLLFVDLLQLVHHKKAFPLPKVPYDRREQFGPWVSPKDDDTCLNIRGLVMVRDADGPVTFTADGCSVQSGAWKDPYTAKIFKSADEMRIALQSAAASSGLLSTAAEVAAWVRDAGGEQLSERRRLIAQDAVDAAMGGDSANADPHDDRRPTGRGNTMILPRQGGTPRMGVEVPKRETIATLIA